MDIDNIRAFVIRAVDYGETSKILTLFSEQKGIISVMSRGVKSPKSKKHNLISLYTEADFELNKRNDFYYLKDGIIVNSNLEIRSNIKKIYLTQMIFDLVERTIVKNEEEDNIYKLVQKTIIYLSKTDNLIRLANMFLIKYISMIGFRPILNRCVNCGENNFQRIYFSYEKGGIVCENHFTQNSKILDRDEYVYLNQIFIEIFENIDIINNEIDEIKIFKLIIEFIRYNTDIMMPKSYTNFIKLMGIN